MSAKEPRQGELRHWVELTLPAGDPVDELAAMLMDALPEAEGGVQIRGTDIVLWVPAHEADRVAAALGEFARALRARGVPVDPGAITRSAPQAEDGWRDAWKQHFRVDRVTPGLVIVPSWEQYQPGGAERVMHLDPGCAFGTGKHGSTRMCLAEVQRLFDEGVEVDRFLDVGTGSGILSLAALLLWPRSRGVALDCDPEAVAAARENLEKNRVLDRMDVSGRDVAAIGEAFPLVLANIQADVLTALCPDLTPRVAPGGVLVLSGLVTELAGPVIDLYLAAGFTLGRTREDQDSFSWTAATMVKKR